MLRSVLYGKYVLALFCIVFGDSILAAQLTPEQQAAKERGIILYNQYKDGEPDLRIAAAAGDREAQYYLAEDLRHTARYMTAEAYKWYVAAAEQDDMYAMFRLGVQKDDLCSAMGNCPEGGKSPGDWMKQLWATAKPLTEQGNGEAMMILYNATGDLDWLEKSAAAEYARGQWFLAEKYQDDSGVFIFPWKRKDRIDELYEGSAKNGFPKGMLGYVFALKDQGNLASARSWLEKGAETGYAELHAEYAASLSRSDNKFGFPVDYVKGYALMSLLLELNGGGNMLRYAEKELPKIATHLNPEQIEEAKEIASQWKATHPPLSYFPDKLGF